MSATSRNLDPHRLRNNAAAGTPDVRLSGPPHPRHHSGDGRGGAVRVSAAAADPRRPRRHPGRRQRDARSIGAYPCFARIERTALRPVLHLGRQAAAWRSRRVADFEWAGAANDQPACRAVDQRRAVDHHSLDHCRGTAWRDRGVETRHVDRPLRGGIVGFGPFLERIILPTCALSFIYVALIARMTRAAMLDVLGEDYVRTARGKGISESGVLLRHALGNAAVPVVTVIGSGFALLISGVVVTESVFNLPGIGRLTVDAVLARDYPVIQAMILLTSGIYVAVNLLIDVAYTLLDPRIRY